MCLWHINEVADLNSRPQEQFTQGEALQLIKMN